MNSRRDIGQLCPILSPSTAEGLEFFTLLGRRVAHQAAIEHHNSFSEVPGWTNALAEQAEDASFTQMRTALRIMLLGADRDPSGKNWQTIWTAMEAGHRETMTALLKAAGQRGGRVLQ